MTVRNFEHVASDTCVIMSQVFQYIGLFVFPQKDIKHGWLKMVILNNKNNKVAFL